MRERLWVRIAAAFLVFASAGTIGLILVLNTTFQRWSRGEFEALATANAEFIRSSRLVPTERLAQYLSQMLGVEVRFGPPPNSDPRLESVTVPVEAGVNLTLTRERPTLRAVLRRPVAIGSLAAFWLLWFGLAWAVVHPYLQSQRLALLGRMAANLAHEIQNPVAAIRLHGQLLAETHPDTASLIVDEATAIEGLVNQWMFLARPEPPRKTPVALADVLRQTLRLLAPAADHARVEVRADLAGAAEVQADARRLGQVFRNVVLNAIQAMPGGGTLTVTARDRTITLADTGPGFSATALSRCGRRMYSEKEGGMGIGLTVAQGIVDAHGGQLTLANRPEGGALVRIQL